ncbi:hypothetical protein [Paenibacillus cineris]|uniref:hypothetical protein n=1 Tax=Paenibacillus cineris TaxID=237530 RepID=UPI001B2BD762|nr:hypothetical protein [Paenibacillus cineris]GIO60614.1 hypothetical protein J43TS9_21880 [Paenibacillus cineris]
MKLHLINSTRTNNFNDPGMMGKIQVIWNEALGKVERHRNMIYGIYMIMRAITRETIR